MISGIGVDIIEVSRLKRELSQGDKGFIQSLFTEEEIRYCESKRSKSQFYAARFAAKEALLKALGTGLRTNMKWKDIEIVHDEMGKPLFSFSGGVKEFVEERRIKNVQLSLSHVNQTAIAFVVLE